MFWLHHLYLVHFVPPHRQPFSAGVAGSLWTKEDSAAITLGESYRVMSFYVVQNLTIICRFQIRSLLTSCWSTELLRNTAYWILHLLRRTASTVILYKWNIQNNFQRPRCLKAEIFWVANTPVIFRVTWLSLHMKRLQIVSILHKSAVVNG